MPPRWNAWTHMQAVRFDYKRQPKPRHGRLCGLSIGVDAFRVCATPLKDCVAFRCRCWHTGMSR